MDVVLSNKEAQEGDAGCMKHETFLHLFPFSSVQHQADMLDMGCQNRGEEKDIIQITNKK